MTFASHHPAIPDYRPDIDGLRAVAVMAVVGFHAFPGWLPGGFVGVDVFFVISGYLISSIILRGVATGTFRFSDFYIRRARRIFPALSLVLAASMVFGRLVLLPEEYRQLGKHLAAGAGFVANLVLWREAGYFDASAEVKPLLHLWSLGVEEQFYLAWPVLLWICRKRPGGLAVIAAMWCASLALNIHGVRQDAVATFYSPLTRFWELLSGSLLAWAALRGRPDAGAFGTVLSALGLLLLAFGLFAIDKAAAFPGLWALVPVSGAALLIAAGPRAWGNRVILSNRVAVWLGLISFPLYLWHWPLLSFAHIIEGGVPVRGVRMGAVAAAIVLAWLTYRVVERPLRFGRHGGRKAAGVAAALVLLGGLGYGIHALSWGAGDEVRGLSLNQIGWDSIPIATAEQSAACGRMFPERAALASKIRNDDFCLLQKDARPNVVMVGDSANLSLFPGLSQFDGYTIAVLAASAAAPLYGVRTTEFGDEVRRQNYRLTHHALDYVVRDDGVKVVVMAFQMGPLLTDPSSPFRITRVSQPEDGDARRVFTQALADTLRRLERAGKRVIFVLPYPTLPHDIKSCVRTHLPIGMGKPCTEPAEAHLARGGAEYRQWVAAVLKDFPRVTVFDAADTMCDRQTCRAVKDGQILYRDAAHLSDAGSLLAAPKLREMILAALVSAR